MAQTNQQDESKQMEEMKKTMIKKILSKGALERLGRIRVVKPELANQLELYLIQLYQNGKIKGEVSDDQLKMFLDAISTKQSFKIIR
ncbi:MAG TPA: DNA-binding protein [archaeon]|nr:DNA-binding protein [archaeon]